MKNLLKRSILKRSPYDLLKNIDHKIKAGRISSRPPWYDAMKLVPMAPMPSAYEDTAKSGAFGGIDSSIEKTQLFFSTNQTRKIQKRKNVSVMPIKMCREIEFPEDLIRAKFYESHPFELNRPRSLIDSDYALLHRDWCSIYGGNIPAPVTGESVVQYTLYLMSEKGGALNETEAYKIALDEFYRVRKEEEIREREETILKTKTAKTKASQTPNAPSIMQGAIESLEAMDLSSAKPKSESIIKIEQIEIEDGQAFAQIQTEALETKRAAYKKLAAFEHQQTMAKG